MNIIYKFIYKMTTICISSNYIFLVHGDIKQIRINDGQLIRSIDLLRSCPKSVCVSPDEQFLYTAGSIYHFDDDDDDDNDIDRYSIEDGSHMTMNGCKGDCVCISPDGRFLFIFEDTTGEIQVVDVEDTTNVRTLYFDQLRLQPTNGNMCLSPDGNQIFVAAMNRICILHPNGEERILQIPFVTYCICVSMDGEFIFASDGSNKIKVLSIEDGRVVRTIPCGTDTDYRINNFCVSQDNQEIFTTTSISQQRLDRIRVFQI
jgi:WD40 repeat protein